jgi:hypothetical protein
MATRAAGVAACNASLRAAAAGGGPTSSDAARRRRAPARRLKGRREARRRDGAGNERSSVMNKKQIALAVVLADFAALNVCAIAQHGVVGLFELAFANAGTTLLFATSRSRSRW